MKVMVVEPMKEPEIREIGKELKDLQAVVGGWIECYSPFNRSDISIVCNEEGKLLGLPQNRMVIQDHSPVDILCGTFFICSLDQEEEGFSSLTDEQVQWLQSRISTAGIFVS